MKSRYAIIALLLCACSSIQYTSTKKKVLPELGTIGVFEQYALQDVAVSKTVLPITDPIRLKFEEIQVSKRKIFTKKDSIPKKKKDSTHIYLSVLDQLELLRQVKQNKMLCAYLETVERAKVVTALSMYFPETKINSFRTADEAYLVKNKQATLSIELRKEGALHETIEFTDGRILSFEASSFCWSNTRGSLVEISDLTNSDNCGSNSYRSARRAERNSEIKFR